MDDNPTFCLQDRDELACRDWISMRDEVWRIEDFLAKWQETSKVAGKIAGSDPVAMILMKEIDAYRRAIPYLKYVRGNGWEKKHWNRLFDMIKLPTKGPNAVSPENLKLSHFLDKADNLAKASKHVIYFLLGSCPTALSLVALPMHAYMQLNLTIKKYTI